MSEVPTFTTNPHTIMSDRVVIAMVGLPARGKSYISKAIVRYLKFLGCPAQIFNAGNKRRDEGAAGVSANFFDASNADAKAQRERMAMDTLDELLEWLQAETRPEAGCACGIFDATNTTIDRRENVRQRIAREQPPVRLIFVETICDDQKVLENNYRMKLSNDDYKGTDPEAAINDFKSRVAKYEAVYENLIDAGRKLVVTNCEGSYVISELLSLLHSFSLAPRCIWIALVGETANDLKGILGGDSQLSTDGLEYARGVADYVRAREGSDELFVGGAPPEPAMVITGTLRRYQQMGEELGKANGGAKRRIVLQLRGMNELCAGKLDSLTYEQMKTEHPREYAARSADKLHYRYPGTGGESYMDLIMRLDSIITTLEQVRGNVLLVCDRAVCRVLMGYFDAKAHTELESLPHIKVDPGVIELRRSHSGFSCTHHSISAGAASTAAGPGTSLEGQTANIPLNEPAQKLWGCAFSTASVRAVFLTFGSHSMADFLLNWVEHVKRLDQKLYLVGALDAKLAALCLEHGIPAATISDATLESMGANKLGAQATNTYYRYAPGTFLRMGLIKQVFIKEMLSAGLDAMVSDVDVAWLRSPWPLVRYGAADQPGGALQPRCKLLALADVVLSVDQVQQYMDTDKHYWHIGSELNTGVAFFRNSKGALAVLDEWKVTMAHAIAQGNPNHDQYWLNEVLRPRDFENLKKDRDARARWLPEVVSELRAADPVRVGLPSSADEFNASDPSLRAIFLYKRKFGTLPAASGVLGDGKTGRLEPAIGSAPVTIGTFPIAEVSNGHTFFVQKLHDIVGVPPVCVHTTYQYGDSTAYAYGKRERLRDAHLWLLDQPDTHWSGRFLQLTSPAARQLAPMKAELLLPEVIDAEHCVKSHLKLTMLQRQWLMDAFVVAKALKRTLILPPIWCMLDRFWTILNHCLIGSQVEMPQPFICPLDHSFNLPGMVDYGLEWREHTFLTNPSAPPALEESAVSIHVGDAAGTPTAPRAVAVASGATFKQLVSAVEASAEASGAALLRIDASALGKLCRCLGGLDEVHDLAKRLPRLLSNDFHYCDTTDNPYFVECKKHSRQGCRKHKQYLMNVSRGIQSPPALTAITDCNSCQAYTLPKNHISEGVIGATSV